MGPVLREEMTTLSPTPVLQWLLELSYQRVWAVGVDQLSWEPKWKTLTSNRHWPLVFGVSMGSLVLMSRKCELRVSPWFSYSPTGFRPRVCESYPVSTIFASGTEMLIPGHTWVCDSSRTSHSRHVYEHGYPCQHEIADLFTPKCVCVCVYECVCGRPLSAGKRIQNPEKWIQAPSLPASGLRDPGEISLFSEPQPPTASLAHCQAGAKLNWELVYGGCAGCPVAGKLIVFVYLFQKHWEPPRQCGHNRNQADSGPFSGTWIETGRAEGRRIPREWGPVFTLGGLGGKL